MSGTRHAATIDDLRELAIRRLPGFVSDYLERGAGDGGGVARNVDAFRKYRLVPRALVPVSPVDTRAELFGRAYASGFGISAIGTTGIYRRHADEMLAEVARDTNVPFILSGSASASVEAISRIAPEQTWYQLYGAKHMRLTMHMVDRARDCGVRVLVYTVDYPIPPRSEVATRTGISLATGPSFRQIPSLLLDALRHPRWTTRYLVGGGMPKLESWAPYAPAGSGARQVARFYIDNWLSQQTWHDLAAIRKRWDGALVVKGLVHPDDVKRALELGGDAVTISNHGGNKLDCMHACLDTLALIRNAVGREMPLFFDGGIRRGSDIVVATALGADHCFVGRATLYGVAADGVAGARRAVDILQSELTYTMAMTGCPTLADISGELLSLDRP